MAVNSLFVLMCRYTQCVKVYPLGGVWVNLQPQFAPSWIFSLCEFGHSGVLIVRYLCSVPNLVQISVIVSEIDAHMLQTFI